MNRTWTLPALLALCLCGTGVRSDGGFSPATFRHSLLDPKMVPNGHKPKVIGDFSGTGRGDVAVMTIGEGMKLYRYPDWTQSLISPAGEQGGEDAQVADVNRDGAEDIVVGDLFNRIAWLENPRRAGQDPYVVRWREHVINQGVPSHDLVVGDVNGDGKVDVAVNGGLFLQDAPDSWTFVGTALIRRGAEGTALGALTGDRFLDVLAPSPDKPYRLCWFENPLHHGGNPTKDVWTRHDVGPGYAQMALAVADLNGDGRLDVLMAPMYETGGLVWFEAPRDPRHGLWTEHVIDPTIQFVHQGSLQVADFNGSWRVRRRRPNRGSMRPSSLAPWPCTAALSSPATIRIGRCASRSGWNPGAWRPWTLWRTTWKPKAGTPKRRTSPSSGWHPTLTPKPPRSA